MRPKLSQRKNAAGEYDGSGSRNFTISTINAEGKTFIEQMKELDKMCAIYGNGEQAVSARCITAEDINRITGYNPNKTGTGAAYSYPLDNSVPVSDYGMKVTYKFTEDGVVQYSYTYNGKVETMTEDDDNVQYTVFKKIAETTNASELNTASGFTVTCDCYSYQMNTLTSNKAAAIAAKLPTVVNVMEDSNIYKMLESGNHRGTGGNYWLNNAVARTRGGNIQYGILTVRNTYQVGNKAMWRTDLETNNNSESNVVRAVVYVDPDAVLKKGTVKSTQNGFTIDCWVFEENNNQQ